MTPPDLLVALMAVHVHGARDVSSKIDVLAAKPMKAAIKDALEAGLLDQARLKVPKYDKQGQRALDKKGNPATQSLVHYSLTDSGRARLAGAFDPGPELRQRRANDLLQLRDDVIGQCQQLLRQVEQSHEQMAVQIDAYLTPLAHADDAPETEDYSEASDTATTEGTEVGGVEPSSDDNLAAIILEGYDELRLRDEYRDGIIDIPRLFQKTLRERPSLTIEQFHDELLRLRDQSKLELRIANEPHHVDHPEWAIRRDDTLFYYVDRR